MLLYELTGHGLTRPTVQRAVLELDQNTMASYKFTNRGGTKFTRDMYTAVRAAIDGQFPISVLRHFELEPAARLRADCATWDDCIQALASSL